MPPELGDGAKKDYCGAFRPFDITEAKISWRITAEQSI